LWVKHRARELLQQGATRDEVNEHLRTVLMPSMVTLQRDAMARSVRCWMIRQRHHTNCNDGAIAEQICWPAIPTQHGSIVLNYNLTLCGGAWATKMQTFTASLWRWQSLLSSLA